MIFRCIYAVAMLAAFMATPVHASEGLDKKGPLTPPEVKLAKNNAMVTVPAGDFWMGCNSKTDNQCGDGEKPGHKVYLDAYKIDKTEVTANDYKACVGAGGCSYNGGSGDDHTYNNNRGNHPINYVNWTEAKTYCEWLGKRLPTAAEWEKAARGTDGRKYSWGDSPEVSCDYAVRPGCGQNGTWEVGSKPLGASPYGALDMIGNVWEWTADWYSPNYYRQVPAAGWVNPKGPDNGMSRILRGGSWPIYGTGYFRASFRYDDSPANRDNDVGFRCAQ